MRILLVLSGAVLLALSACQALQAVQGPDTEATLLAEGAAYVAEATAIAATALSDQAIVEATVAAAGTQAAELGSINQQLLATARAAIPPTPPRVVGSAPQVEGQIAPENMDAVMEGGLSSSGFMNTGVSASVRQSDGCADGLQTQFTSSTARIYATTRAASIRAGTVMSVEWRRNGELVFSDNWTVQRDATNFCLWYFITPEDVPFQPGQWSVRLFADGAAIEPEAAFVITEG